ncbi:MAG: YegP family protein, partial [Saprospiraceae bacterium]|nr:YegP family protein [Saprospiraceae bacterium]
RQTAANGKFYFTLKAANSQVVGNSQMYESEASRDNGIASVQNNAPDATVDDQTAA